MAYPRPCRDYQTGNCRFASACRFLHEIVPPASTHAGGSFKLLLIKSNFCVSVCHSFERTQTCKFGALCRFSHNLRSDVEPPVSPPPFFESTLAPVLPPHQSLPQPSFQPQQPVFQLPQSVHGKLFVGNIAPGTTTEQLKDLFSQFGPLRDKEVDPKGLFAFIYFEHRADMEKAMQASPLLISGQQLKLEESREQIKKKPMDNHPNSDQWKPQPLRGGPNPILQQQQQHQHLQQQLPGKFHFIWG